MSQPSLIAPQRRDRHCGASSMRASTVESLYGSVRPVPRAGVLRSWVVVRQDQDTDTHVLKRCAANRHERKRHEPN